MNDLGRTLIWLAVQVTLLAGTAALGYAFVAWRRRPAAAAQVAAAALAGCVVLTLAAASPLPVWWTWQGMLAWPAVELPATVVSDSELPEESTVIGASHANSLGVILTRSIAWLHIVEDCLEQTTPAPSDLSVNGLSISAAVLLAGSALGLGRLLLGVWAVSRYRRAGRRIDDPCLNELVASLRTALGCRQQVTLREYANFSGPATVGWWRPELLLPTDWRTWDDAERRAVLAHELAHVHHGDFTTRVVAGLGVALHFYHPLLHWLNTRLRLQQELAADALAASVTGGQECYLRALAKLALRLDGSAPSWPAHTLFSSPATLMKRIQMLRSKDGLKVRHTSGAVLTALLLASIAAVSAIRSPAQPREDEKAAIEAVEKLGGRVAWVENAKGKPVFSVKFPYK